MSVECNRILQLLCRVSRKIRHLDQSAEIGILDSKVSGCLHKLKGRCGAQALHPYWKGMDLSKEDLDGITVRVWLSEHLYP